MTLKYQWKANNLNISGATANTYTLPATLKGKRVTVTVTGSKTGYTSAAKTSAASVPVAPGTLVAATPKITGTAKVGYKLTATAGAWRPSPVTLKYQWKANNVNISGATATTYTLPATRKGKRITVTVTASKTGFTSLARTSAATATAIAAEPGLSSTPAKSDAHRRCRKALACRSCVSLPLSICAGWNPPMLAFWPCGR